MEDFLETSQSDRLPVLQLQANFVPSTVRFYDPKDLLVFRTGHLPHWRQEGKTYFLTFVLFDALPEKVKKRVQEKRSVLKTSIEQSLHLEDRVLIRDVLGQLYEEALHKAQGECFLESSICRKIVRDALCFFSGDRYVLHAWVLMPNHVHVLATMKRGEDLGRVLHSWKSYTAHKMNKALGRNGKVWQRETFDRIVRNEGAFCRYKAYILSNPKGLRSGTFQVGVET